MALLLRILVVACVFMNLSSSVLPLELPKHAQEQFKERFKKSSTNFGGNSFLKELDGTVLVVTGQAIPANYALARWARIDIRDDALSADRDHEEIFEVGEMIWVADVAFKNDRIEITTRSIERDNLQRKQHRSAVLRFFFDADTLSSGDLETIYRTIDNWVRPFDSLEQAKAALAESDLAVPDYVIGDFKVSREAKDALKAQLESRYKFTKLSNFTLRLLAAANEDVKRAQGRPGIRSTEELYSVDVPGDIFVVLQDGLYGNVRESAGPLERTRLVINKGVLRESPGRKDAYFDKGDKFYLLDAQVTDFRINTHWLSQKRHRVFDERRGEEWEQRIVMTVGFTVDPQWVRDGEVDKVAAVIEEWLTPEEKMFSTGVDRKETQTSSTTFSNDDVIKLLAQDFSEDLILVAIRSAREVEFLLDIEELIKMKAAGASEAILKAMMERQNERNR